MVRARMRGVLAGLKEALRDADGRAGRLLDGDGQFKLSLERVRRHLREAKTQRVLVGAANDSSALGPPVPSRKPACPHCAIVGQNAEPDARAELRAQRTPLIASVAYLPERYGEELIHLALEILGGGPSAGHVRQAPGHHRRQRRSLLSERRPASGGVPHRACVEPTKTTKTAKAAKHFLQRHYIAPVGLHRRPTRRTRTAPFNLRDSVALWLNRSLCILRLL